MKLYVVTSVIPLLIASTLISQTISDEELNARAEVNKTLFDGWDHGFNLVEKARETNSDVTLNPVVFETPVQCDPCEKIDPSDSPDVKAAAAQSDLVAVGKVVQNTSVLSKNQAFVITDSQLVISDVWKVSPKLAAQPRQDTQITVANAGGSVIVDGHKISAYPSNLKPLQVGHIYLLFLMYVPASRSYINAGLDGFDITATSVIPVHQNLPPPAASLIGDRDRFVGALHDSTMKAAEVEAR